MSRYVERIFSPRDDHFKKYWSDNPLSGMRNLGNTCYMNSVIQSLSNTQQLRSYSFHHAKPTQGKAGDKTIYRGSLVRAFTSIVNALWSGEYSFVTPLAIKDIVSENHAQFGKSDQNDAHEFLLILLEMLDDELKKKDTEMSLSFSPTIVSPIVLRLTRNLKPLSLGETPTASSSSSESGKVSDNETEKSQTGNVISDNFEGKLKRKTECMGCHFVSEQTESFYCLSIPLKRTSISFGLTSLQKCIELFFQDEFVDGWKCDHCGQMCQAKLSTSLHTTPNVLIIQLIKDYPTKADKLKVVFPQEDLTIQKENNNNFDFYDLYSYITHTGNLSRGHYISYNKVFGQWFCCDDEKVSKSALCGISDSIYLLFYEKKG